MLILHVLVPQACLVVAFFIRRGLSKELLHTSGKEDTVTFHVNLESKMSQFSLSCLYI